MAKKTTLEWIVLILVIVGGLNWGLVGLANWDIVNMILGGFAGGWIARIVYILVGLSALYMIYQVAKK